MARHRDRPLRRNPPRREVRRRLLILCEGDVTEPEYFKAFRHDHRNRLVEIELVPDCGVPKTVVEFAVERKKAAEREARRFRDPYLKYDEVWCVFDVDDHPNLQEARQQAQDNGLRLAISNPCFELWILLHFQDQRAFQERGRIQAACQHHLPRFNKEVPYETVRSHYDDAVRRAEELIAWQERQGRPHENPTTYVHLLTERIVELGKEAFLRG